MSKVTLLDITLKDYTFDNLKILKKLREELFERGSDICIERARYLTKYLKDLANKDEPYTIQRAKAIAYYLANREPVFHDNNLIAGSTTSKPVGAPLYPEFFALAIWPELESISDRKKNPQKLTKEDADELNFDIYPYWLDRSILEITRAEYPESTKLFDQFIFFIASKAGCISHTIPNYKVVINKGLNYLIDLASSKEKELSSKGDLNDEQQRSLHFYQAVQISLQGILDYAANVSKKATQLAAETSDPDEKKLFEELAEICKNVPAKPASTFREALNAIWIVRVGLLAENSNMAMSPGRLDQILYPFYKKDIEENRLTVEEAIELVGCLWLKLSDNVIMVPEVSEELFGGAGNVPAVTLGGIDENGKDAVNDLTYVMLRATELLQTRDPNMCARYHYKENLEEYRNRVCEVIANTKAVPAFYNDIEAINTLMNQGVSLEDARDYGVVGCVELASNGRSYNASSSIILNIVVPLELALYNGTRPFTGDKLLTFETGDPSGFETFEEFWKAYTAQLTYIIENAINLNNKMGLMHRKYLPTPMLSAIFEGPLEKGQDLIYGGAIYNSSGATHIGFADAVDSLNAIEKVVYNDGQCSFGELIKALKENFDGQERLYQYLVNKTPKYGTEDETAKNNANRMIEFLYDTYHNAENYRDGKYRPAYWTMTNHAGMGSLSGALPNGRKAKVPFASGITPVSGAAAELTACLNSVGGLNTLDIPGGYPLNLKFTRISTEEDLEKFASFIEAYFVSGGLQVQFNIMSYAMLLEARKDPTKYPHLMVRVSGYSAYFNDLNELMKEELITRTQYDLKTGKAISYIEG
ncbi:MAG: hypothetical protein KAX49_16140 [Halanaerobiales bacterium]|nr:hypothetical protein [Halanaerobiales bacterium]